MIRRRVSEFGIQSDYPRGFGKQAAMPAAGGGGPIENASITTPRGPPKPDEEKRLVKN